MPSFRPPKPFATLLLALFPLLAAASGAIAQTGGEPAVPDTLGTDSVRTYQVDGIVVSASRISESLFRSPVSVEQLRAADAAATGAPTVFDAIEHVPGVQMITPSLGFRVINTRGFANTTNVRFAQLVDGVDNQAPHLGAPIANALGASGLDIEAVEIVPGTASALYGMNAINGLANIRTKNPFSSQGLSIEQLTGLNHAGKYDPVSAHLYRQTQMRYASALGEAFAFKINGSVTSGEDWVADDRSDLGAALNASTLLFGRDNPAYDEVNGYGNESPNRRTLTLNGKKYVVARTGYRESEIADYGLRNLKGDLGLYCRPSPDQQLSFAYKGALLNDIYQRSNRFRLQDYALQQYSLEFLSVPVEARAYLTHENTGESYNLRSLAENMDRAFKPDDKWFTDYTNAYSSAIASSMGVAEAHHAARAAADLGRYVPGTEAFRQKQNELTTINNWDYGAALRVRSDLVHGEGLVRWDKIWGSVFAAWDAQLLSGFDYRTYIIVPDGNYFINPVDSGKNLTYGKTGGFVQLSKGLFGESVRLSATLRADKADYFNWKLNPRFTAVVTPAEDLSLRASYQSGYRFPSIFEGFSNVNSGGVKRVGGLRVMSSGIFERSYTKSSIDAFQAQVNSDVNSLGLTQVQAIAKNADLLRANPYTYLEPEYIRSTEFGVRANAFGRRLAIDADIYYNSYDHFIAQVEANIPTTSEPDSIPTYLYSKAKQNRYRLWTNSRSRIFTIGGSLGLTYAASEHLSLLGNVTLSRLSRTEDKDGLEDGYNTPPVMVNASAAAADLWQKLGAGVTCHYQSKFDYVSFLVSGEVPESWSVDAQVSYAFETLGLGAKLAATNLLNSANVSLLGGPSVGALYYLSLTFSPQR